MPAIGVPLLVFLKIKHSYKKSVKFLLFFDFEI
jgi:hypothetical protein